MSRRRELAQRLGALTDIADILGAMKSLALMETRILLGFIACQERMVAGIEVALAEFLAWHPELIQPAARVAEGEGGCIPWRAVTPAPRAELRPPARFVPETALWVLVGSEQGFCGDFNARLAARVRDSKALALAGRWLVVGQRLATKLGDDPRILLQLPGATVADEVPAVLLRLTRELSRLLGAASVAAHQVGGQASDPAGVQGGDTAREPTGRAMGEIASEAAWKPAGGGLGVLYQDEATNTLQLRQLLPLGGPSGPSGAIGVGPPMVVDGLPPGAPKVLPPAATQPVPPAKPEPIPPSKAEHNPHSTVDPISPKWPERTRIHPFPPAIQLPPGELLDGLTRHYLYAVLNQVLYSSLTAENRQRQAHMDQALQRLQEKVERLRRACNAQRQEEITEEIEIILLSADAMN